MDYFYRLVAELPFGVVSITGTLAATENPDGASFNGSIAATGTLAVSEATDAAAFAGSVVVSGALAVTEALDTAAFAGSVVVSGTLATSEATDVAAFAGSVVAADISGTLAVTEATDVAAFAGDVAVALGAVYLDPTLLGADIVLSNANLTATQTAAATGNARANAHHASGKYYCEFTANVIGNMQIGVCSADLPLTQYLGENNAFSIGADDGGGWQGAGGTTTAPTLIAGHVYGLAIDIDARKAWLKDLTAAGNWNDNASADPVTGVNGATFTTVG